MARIASELKTLFHTGFFHIFGSSAVNKIVTFLSSVVLIRILTKLEYGIFTYAWNIYSIIVLLNGMGIDAGIMQIASENGGDTAYTNSISNFGVRFGVRFDLALCMLVLGVGLFAPLNIQGADRLLCLLCLLPILQLLFQMTTAYLRAQKRNQEYAKLTTLNTIMVFAISAICAFAFREAGLIVGYYAAYIASFIIGRFVYKIRLFNDSQAIAENDRKDILRIAAITMLNNGLSQLLYLLDTFVLGIVDPQETVLASYKVATMIPSALNFIPIALVTYLYPYFSEHRRDGGWCIKKYKQILLCLGTFNLLVSGVLFFGAPLIIRLMFGAQYLDAVSIFRVLAINYFFSGTFRVLSGNLLVTQRKLKFNLSVAIISSAINVLADYFFIQWWGAIGAAFASSSVVLISSILNTAYLIYTFKKSERRMETNDAQV